MKIAVTGKGGVGKTTFAATLARLYADEGKKVLAADVDPDANLGLALGFDEETLDSIVPISKMRKLIEENDWYYIVKMERNINADGTTTGELTLEKFLRVDREGKQES